MSELQMLDIGLRPVVVLACIALGVVFASWLHREYEIVGGLWILAWFLVSIVVRLPNPLMTKAIVDDYIVPGGHIDWSVQEYALAMRALSVFGMLAKTTLFVLLSSELLWLLGRGRHLPRLLEWVRNFQIHRHRLGATSLILVSIPSLVNAGLLLSLWVGSSGKA